MKTKIQIKSIFGKLLFELEKENNSVKNTLIEAVISDADLGCADLIGEDLRGADLRGAFLIGADLSGADLSGANLSCADLRDADLSDANLRYADLRGANLGDANLRYADLIGVDLSDVALSGAKYLPFIPTYLPEGEFIAWKKLSNGLIAKLKILEDSKRSRAASDKCRCDKCFVLEFQNVDGSVSSEKTYTSYKFSVCTYTVGEVVYADSWDDNRWNECSHGIHFFIDRQSAVDY